MQVRQRETNASVRHFVQPAPPPWMLAQHAWRGYTSKAWGRDELKPQSGTGQDNWGGVGMTLVDSLDTLWVMGLKVRAPRALPPAPLFAQRTLACMDRTSSTLRASGWRRRSPLRTAARSPSSRSRSASSAASSPRSTSPATASSSTRHVRRGGCGSACVPDRSFQSAGPRPRDAAPAFLQLTDGHTTLEHRPPLGSELVGGVDGRREHPLRARHGAGARGGGVTPGTASGSLTRIAIPVHLRSSSTAT